MATAHRVFWETVIFLSFLVILAGVLLWGGKRVQWREAELDRQHQESLRIDSEKHQAEIAGLRQDWNRRLAERSLKEAEAVLGAFEAGARTAITARWGRYLATATESLARRPEVLFLHIVTPQGQIITSSDETLRNSGRLDDGQAWVTTGDEIRSRGSSEPGDLELVMPVRESGRVVAFLWMGYRAAASEAAAQPVD